jgi:hypothetical protein
VLGAADMCEFTSLERCAAYVAARSAMIAVQDAAARWPDALGDRARRDAVDTVQLTAQAVSHEHASAGRRLCLREAIAAALGMAAAIDAAADMGYAIGDAVELQRAAGRTVALLGMLLHAGTAVPDGYG